MGMEDEVSPAMGTPRRHLTCDGRVRPIAAFGKFMILPRR
jgi:hypothetical protein